MAASATTNKRTTTLYLVRHAEALHNIREKEAIQAAKDRGIHCKEAHEKARKAVLVDERLTDAPLSTNGLKECRHSSHQLSLLTKVASSSGLSSLVAAASDMEDTTATTDCTTPTSSAAGSSNISTTTTTTKYLPPQVVLVSPLRRALMTATELFLPNTANHPKIIALEILREKRTGFAADERSSVATLQTEFPHVDFSNLVQNTTITPDKGEDNPKVRQRAQLFVEESLAGFALQYDSIAVVTHKGWLRELRHGLSDKVSKDQLQVDFDLQAWQDTLYQNAEIRVASFGWESCCDQPPLQLTSIVSRSVENALGSLVETAVQHLLQRQMQLQQDQQLEQELRQWQEQRQIVIWKRVKSYTTTGNTIATVPSCSSFTSMLTMTATTTNVDKQENDLTSPVSPTSTIVKVLL